MNILHLLVSGGTGGIEILCKEYTLHSKNRNVVVCLWGSGDIAEEMKKLGVIVLDQKFLKGNVVGTIRYILRVCKQYDIDVIITQHESPILHIYMNIICFIRPKIKSIAYAHSNAVNMCEEKRRKGLFFRKGVLKYSFEHANIDIAISNSVKNSLYRVFNLKNNNIEVVYNGIDVEKFSSETHVKKDHEFNIIYVGRLIKEKGVQDTIKALSMLPNNTPWKFLIVGDGPYRTELKELSKRVHCSDQILFLGNKRNVPELLSRADCFIHLPVCEEGFGITIIEAMAAGKICLCNDNGAIPEIIQSNYNGFLVRAGDLQNTSCKISEIIRNFNEPYMRKIELNAKQRAEEFSIERYVEKIDGLIDAL